MQGTSKNKNKNLGGGWEQEWLHDLEKLALFLSLALEEHKGVLLFVEVPLLLMVPFLCSVFTNEFTVAETTDSIPSIMQNLSGER